MPHPLRMPRLGVLGSGQLARMLAQAAQKMGIPLQVLADHRDSPAAQVCPDVTEGSIHDSRALRNFFSRVDQVIFENEFIPCDLIENAAEGLPVRFTPTIAAMHFLQDKLNQKKTLANLGIPSARHLPAPFPVTDEAVWGDWLATTAEELGPVCILKWAQLGYDGKGTRKVDLGTDSGRETALLFCNEASMKRVRVYAEEYVPFKREVALIACHSTEGEFKHYPLVVSEQESNVCLWTKGPATALGVKKALETQAARAALRLAREIPLHGTFAIEFFETKKGRLLVNEIAPRVHNTGHFTLDAADTSQFENHLRAVLGLPLGSTQTRPAFAMVNLLGPAGVRKKLKATAMPPLPAGIHFHWYGKQEVQPGRKMGHLNGSMEVARSAARLKKLVADLEDCKNSWLGEMKK